jgi:hypothetical protein
MRCGKAQAYLSRQADEALPAEVTAPLARHLDACADCRQFRQDLAVGRRLLAATPPQLADNFEWRLHLRLNQALQQAAGAVAFPWDEERTDRRLWIRNFGTAASYGLAAVLALAMFLGPQPERRAAGLRLDGIHLAGQAGDQIASAQSDQADPAGADRLPLQKAGFRGGLTPVSGVQQPVSSGLGAAGSRQAIDRGWSGDLLEDLATIQNLRLENRRLTNQIYQYQLQIAKMRGQLDSADSNALDLKTR